MKKILIAFCALFFLSTLSHASEFKEKVKIENSFTTVEETVVLNSVEVAGFEANEIKLKSSFLPTDYQELIRSEKSTIKYSFKPDRLEADIYSYRLKENFKYIHRLNFHKQL